MVRTSVRTPDGPRSRTVCNITRLPPATRLLIASSLKGQPLVSPDAAALDGALDFGGLAVLREAWARLGLADLFAGLPAAVAGRLQAVIFSRLLFPCAKLSLADHARGSLLAAGEAFDEDDIYAAMDHLTGRWSGLVQGLYRKAFPRKVRIALYDITSVYFEGKGPKGLAWYGHSRDHRGDRPQVNLAVVTDEQGIPISLSVLRGNRADNKTLLGLLKMLRRRFGIESATFVFDGGMSGQINLQAMNEAGLSYVTRLSNATLESLLKDAPEAAASGGRSGTCSGARRASPRARRRCANWPPGNAKSPTGKRSPRAPGAGFRRSRRTSISITAWMRRGDCNGRARRRSSPGKAGTTAGICCTPTCP